jgi:hypothetical protein
MVELSLEVHFWLNSRYSFAMYHFLEMFLSFSQIFNQNKTLITE